MLSKEEMLHSLRMLGDMLAAQGAEVEILLTGGAAMCLVHEARDMTKDIDALYEPKDIINRLAAQIAASQGLPPDWLNDSVKRFAGANAPVDEFMSLNGLRITTVSPEYLLAMKLMSSRSGETDANDICFLLNKLDVKDADEAYGILESFYPRDRILLKTACRAMDKPDHASRECASGPVFERDDCL